MPKIKFIILDFDGVINDLTAAKVKSIKEIFRKLRIKVNRQLIFNMLVYIEQIYENKKIFDYRKILRLVFKKLTKYKLIDIKKKQKEFFIMNFTRYLNKNTSINKNLIREVEKLKKNYGLIICLYTSQKPTSLREIFKNFKIKKNLFDKIYTQKDFEEPKPSIKNLIQICQQIKKSPKNGLIIGDNISTDLMPAKFLGMKTILYSKLINYCVTSSSSKSSKLQEIFQKFD